MVQLRSSKYTRLQFVNTVNKARRSYSENTWIGLNAVVAGHNVIFKSVGTWIQKLTVDGKEHEYHAKDNASFRKFIQGALK